PGDPATLEPGGDRAEHPRAVLGADAAVHGVLRVRHHAHDVAGLVAHAGDVVQRAVGIALRPDAAVRVAAGEHHAVLVPQLAPRCLAGDVAALPMFDGDGEHVAHATEGATDRADRLHPHAHVAADEAEAAIGHQRARQQPRFAEDLEAVADAEHRPTRLRM